MGSHQQEPWLLENGGIDHHHHHRPPKGSSSKETSNTNPAMNMKHGRTAHNMSSSSLRKKSDLALVSKVPCGMLRKFLANLQEVFLGTKLSVLFPAIPMAIVAECYGFGRSWIFALSLLGLTPLAERVSFLTEQIAYYTGPTVGGLLNATCGNATELIIAIFALRQHKIQVVKYSLLGSILSNLLLVLGTSLVCGGLANLRKEQKYDRRQADVNSLMLVLALLCHLLPLLLQQSSESSSGATDQILVLSRASSVAMLVAYVVYVVFQLVTHRQLFESQEDSEDDGDGTAAASEEAVIGFWSGFMWLVLMTLIIALLSEYVVDTIEAAAVSWGLSVSFLSIILLPIVGNAAEHAGAIIFAFKNKLDITLGVALGSATQISMFAVPLCVIMAWIMGIRMDLNFNNLETGSFALAVLLVAFALQDGTSHYMKGLILLLSYIVIGACFYVSRSPLKQQEDGNNLEPTWPPEGIFTS